MKTVAIIVLFLTTPALCDSAANDSPSSGIWPVTKKLIKVGHAPFPNHIRANIRTMEEHPFDGLVFRLHPAGGRYFWQPEPLDPRTFEADFEDLKAIQWKKFTDNFILVWTAAGDKLDWFDEAHWRAVEHNMRLVAKAARLGR